MKKNILVIAAITSASFAIFNCGNASVALGKTSDSTITLERWSTVSQNLNSPTIQNDDNQGKGYTGTDEDGNEEVVETSS
jgi:hypothetical protein